jgi:hypothetical protein
MERLDTHVGPIKVQVVEPLEVLRILVDAPEQGVKADITFRARAAALQEPRFTRRMGPRAFMDYTRLTQNGHYTGWIEVDGKRESVDGFAGTRDRLHDRIHTIVREACMQSRRIFVPQVNVGVDLAEVLGRAGVSVADPEGGPLSTEHQYIVVGPEGGFDPLEVPETIAKVSIGPVVMRAETAALVAGARLVALHERQ